MPADDTAPVDAAPTGRADRSDIRPLLSRLFQRDDMRRNGRRRFVDRPVARYLLAMGFVVVAISASNAVGTLAEKPWAFPLYAAVVASAWVGTGPGWLAVILATLAVQFFWASPFYSLHVSAHELPWFLSFVLCALVSLAWSAQRRRAQDALEGTVEQRTADLQRSNAALQVEIAERLAAEEDLLRSEALLAQGQKLSGTASWTLRLPDGEMQWSAHLFDILGLDPEVRQPSYRLFVERIHPEDRGELLRAIDRAAREKSDFSCEARIVVPGEPAKLVQAVGEAKGDTGEGAEFIGTIMDLTERKRTEQALRDAEAELARMLRLSTLAELAAAVAHEINQPLAAIAANGSACLRSLARDPPLLDTAREAASCIVDDGHRAGEVIAGIRALFNKDEPKQQPLNLNDLIRHVLALSRGLLDRHRVVVRTQFGERPPVVIGDPVQLQQVLVNLVTNAVEAMSGIKDRARRLTIRSEVGQDGATIVTVEDTGSGIDPDRGSRIFDSFYTTKGHGIGVGLAISRSIIEAHGGCLSAVPTERHGAKFRFVLPPAALDPALGPPLGIERAAEINAAHSGSAKTHPNC